jgi:hypothetical protein
MKFRFVCATRESPAGFAANTALGRSLALYRAPIIELRLFANNSRGLPALYNEALKEAAGDPALLIFIHDDVYLCDFYWPGHVLEALGQFDVVGIAGCTQRAARQPAWCFVDERLTWAPLATLSGAVGHGMGFPPARVDVFGPPRQAVKLLDGVLLAVRSETLLSRAIVFDERFDFHFYDMDLCRQAEAKNLRMGTWDISAIHQSVGDYESPAWKAACAQYLEKWRS